MQYRNYFPAEKTGEKAHCVTQTHDAIRRNFKQSSSREINLSLIALGHIDQLCYSDNFQFYPAFLTSFRATFFVKYPNLSIILIWQHKCLLPMCIRDFVLYLLLKSDDNLIILITIPITIFLILKLLYRAPIHRKNKPSTATNRKKSK